MTGTELIAKERQRQITEEGWSTERDEQHSGGELVAAGACYALNYLGFYIGTRHDKGGFSDLWPWAYEWWKPTPKDPVRQLVKAGALIAAEIDKLQRQRGSK